MELRGLNGSETQTIPFGFRTYPLCSGVGDAEVGAAYQGLADAPLEVGIVPQGRIAGPIRTLGLTRSQDDTVLAWEPVPGATAYRVYVAAFADLPRASWTPAGDTTAATFLDPGAATSDQPRYYSVIGLTGEREGDW